MIKIINNGGNEHGVCNYIVQINNQQICKFEHNRLDGLVVCLQKATDEVELSEWADYVLVDEIKGG